MMEWPKEVNRENTHEPVHPSKWDINLSGALDRYIKEVQLAKKKRKEGFKFGDPVRIRVRRKSGSETSVSVAT